MQLAKTETPQRVTYTEVGGSGLVVIIKKSVNYDLQLIQAYPVGGSSTWQQLVADIDLNHVIV